ncbi:MAG: DNA mismatch repair endonuclease MutL, partial [Myxococcota bacterium]
MASIRVLNPSIANQIAAGEVVDGPWSVVKELVENALDAASRHIDIHIEGGGVKRLLVADDGHGMTEADARVCIQRHATSKLRELGDLGSLASFGFRGEALAAIAAVSRKTLTTRAADQDSATQLRIEGGRILQTCRVGAPVGTRVEIRDLFFNTPARRKFLKTARWENAAVERTVRDIALPAHHVGLCVRNEDKIALDIQPVPPHAPLQHPQRMERAVACLGQNTRGMLYPFYSQAKDLAVSGYIAAPLITRRDSRGIKLFVNHRCVNDPQLTQAVRTAYRTLLEVGRLPLCALDIVLPGTDVDVNVHPQKQHVRFREADRVIRHLIHTLRDFLATTPWLGAMPPFALSPQSSSLRSDTLRGPLSANHFGKPQRPEGAASGFAANRSNKTEQVERATNDPSRHPEQNTGSPRIATRQDDKEGHGNEKKHDAQANQPAQYRLPQNVASEV